MVLRGRRRWLAKVGALACLLWARSSAATPQWASLRLQASLEASLVRSLPRDGPALAAEVARLLRWRGDIQRQLHPGDRLALLYDDAARPTADTEPELQALIYVGRQVQLRAYKFADAAGIARFYDGSGTLIEPQLHNPPVPAYQQITETLQVRRRRGQRRHLGIDLKAPTGSPIRLPWAGQVERLNWRRRRNGLCVAVRFDNGRLGRFLHLDKVDPQVRPGARLPAHSRLGWVGSTGHSNAPHLHYELWQGTRPLEPLEAHGHGVGQLAPSALTAFAQRRAAYDRAMQGPP